MLTAFQKLSSGQSSHFSLRIVILSRVQVYIACITKRNPRTPRFFFLSYQPLHAPDKSSTLIVRICPSISSPDYIQTSFIKAFCAFYPATMISLIKLSSLVLSTLFFATIHAQTVQFTNNEYPTLPVRKQFNLTWSGDGSVSLSSPCRPFSFPFLRSKMQVLTRPGDP